ncbi:MAG: S9 family peptidase, partial [Acidobacteriota bacterium]|nr:S9 family peptidase [Acidobacteriota bacterium]
MPAYPPSRRGDDVDAYGATQVADPYRWMEDLESPEVAQWVAAQNAVTRAHLDGLPHRAPLVSRLTELWNYSRSSVPGVENGVLFYSRNSGLQRQAPVYRRCGADGEATLALDPNVLSPDGSVSLAHYAPSPDATLLAYACAKGGADWETIRVRDLVTGRDREDEVQWVRFSDLSWTRDSRGFFYSRYPEPPSHKVLEAALSGQAIYYHRLGTPQADDELIYQRLDHPSWIVNGTVTENGWYLLIRTYRGAEHNNQLHYLALGNRPRLA